MQPDFDEEPLPIDRRTPCPGCNEVGHTVQTWHEPVDGRPIQMMHCPKDRSDCQVSEYYPNTTENT